MAQVKARKDVDAGVAGGAVVWQPLAEDVSDKDPNAVLEEQRAAAEAAEGGEEGEAERRAGAELKDLQATAASEKVKVRDVLERKEDLEEVREELVEAKKEELEKENQELEERREAEAEGSKAARAKETPDPESQKAEADKAEAAKQEKELAQPRTAKQPVRTVKVATTGKRE